MAALNKKGSTLVLVMVIEFVAFIMISGIILYGAQKVSDPETDQMIKMAQEMKLEINALVAVSGDAYIRFPLSMENFGMSLAKSTVTVFKKADKGFTHSESFILPEHYSAEGVVESGNYTCIEKRGRKIIIEGCNKDE